MSEEHAWCRDTIFDCNISVRDTQIMFRHTMNLHLPLAVFVVCFLLHVHLLREQFLCLSSKVFRADVLLLLLHVFLLRIAGAKVLVSAELDATCPQLVPPFWPIPRWAW